MGRPVKYDLAFCTKEIDSFWNTLQKDDKWIYITWHDLVVNRPYSRQRISEWREKFKDDAHFSDTIKKIESELENRLFKLGLKGKANATLVIFGLKNNYGWSDKQEIEHSGLPEKIEISVDKSETGETLKKLRNGSKAD